VEEGMMDLRMGAMREVVHLAEEMDLRMVAMREAHLTAMWVAEEGTMLKMEAHPLELDMTTEQGPVRLGDLTIQRWKLILWVAAVVLIDC